MNLLERREMARLLLAEIGELRAKLGSLTGIAADTLKTNLDHLEAFATSEFTLADADAPEA
jgi:hypothetical protein